MKASDSIRNRINHHPLQAILLARLAEWDALTASLDWIQWCDLALGEFTRLTSSTMPSELQFLHLFGALQAAFVQQDALASFERAIGMPQVVPDEHLLLVREVRNASVGHPTTPIKDRGICLAYLDVGGRLVVLERHQGRGHSHRSHDLCDLLRKQSDTLVLRLESIGLYLDQVQDDHVKKATEVPLSSLVPQQLGYMLEKIGEGVLSNEWYKATWAITALKQFVDAVRAEYVRRSWSLASLPGIEHSLTSIEQGLEFLEVLRADGNHWPEGPKALFLKGFVTEVDELKAMLGESDNFS